MQLRVQSPSNFHVSVESNLWLVQKTCATFSTNHKSRFGRLRFPSLQAVGCFYVEFSLALKCSFLPLTDRCRYFGLGFTKLNQKALFCWLKVIWFYCFTSLCDWFRDTSALFIVAGFPIAQTTLSPFSLGQVCLQSKFCQPCCLRDWPVQIPNCSLIRVNIL